MCDELTRSADYQSGWDAAVKKLGAGCRLVSVQQTTDALRAGEYWCWQGDEHDHPESLGSNMRVVIDVPQLMEWLRADGKRAIAADELERTKTLLANLCHRAGTTPEMIAEESSRALRERPPLAPMAGQEQLTSGQLRESLRVVYDGEGNPVGHVVRVNLLRVLPLPDEGRAAAGSATGGEGARPAGAE